MIVPPWLMLSLAVVSMVQTLVIAKLDRLARNVNSISNLMESGVEFTAVEFPSSQ
jgi:hypothetical protein